MDNGYRFYHFSLVFQPLEPSEQRPQQALVTFVRITAEVVGLPFLSTLYAPVAQCVLVIGGSSRTTSASPCHRRLRMVSEFHCACIDLGSRPGPRGIPPTRLRNPVTGKFPVWEPAQTRAPREGVNQSQVNDFPGIGESRICIRPTRRSRDPVSWPESRLSG